MATDVASLGVKVDSTEVTFASENLDKLTAAGKRAESTAEDVTRRYELMGAVIGASVVAVVGAFAMAVRSTSQLYDQYARLAEIAGTTASALSAFDLPAKLSGTSLDMVAQSVARLGKSLGEARLGDAGKANLFRALGIDPDDGRDAAAVFVDVAKALSTVKDESVASVASNELLQRGFMQLRPLMKQIAEDGGVMARVTDDQNQRGKELSDRMTILTHNAQGMRNALSDGLFPALLDIGDAFQKAEKGGSLFAEIGKVVGNILKMVSSVGLAAYDIIWGLGAQLGAVGAAIVAVLSGNFRQALVIVQEANADTERHTKETNQRITDLWVGTARAQREAAASATGGGGRGEVEQALRERAEFLRTYQQRVGDAKAFAAEFADAIRHQNALTQEARKQGLITEEELIKQEAASEQARLSILIKSLQEQAALHSKKGDKPELVAAAVRQAQEADVQRVRSAELAEARLQTLHSQTLLRQENEYRSWLAIEEQKGAAIAASFGTQQEIEDRAYQARLQSLEVYLKANQDQISNADQLRERLMLEHEARLGDITAQGRLARIKFDEMSWDMQLSTATHAFATLLQGVAGHSKRMFQLWKIAAIADVIVSTSQGVMKAWAQGGWFGGAMAALIAAAGAANLARIRGTEIGGGGGAVPTYSGSPVTGAPIPTPSFGGGGGSPTQVQLIFTGTVIGTEEWVRSALLPIVQELVDDRDFQIMSPNSNNGRQLVEAARRND